jgi:hypothetical protein
MLNKLYNYRFELFFFTIIIILFSPIFLLNSVIGNALNQLAFILNFLAGIVLISKNKKILRLFYLLIGLISLVIIRYFISPKQSDVYEYIKLGSYFVFYIVVSYELIKQVVKAQIISKNVIIGLMCGYICIGLICFFGFLTIELIHPGSFHGIDLSLNIFDKKDSLLYFSYITLLTIGYGDITPATEMSQKLAILTGFLGQFYMVILTAIIVGKYISQISKESNA